MAQSFSEDPLDGVSPSSHAPSDPGTDPHSHGDDLSDGTGSVNVEIGISPSDEESIEVVPRDPNFFTTLGEVGSSAQTRIPHNRSASVIPTKTTQSRNPHASSPSLKKRSDVFDLPPKALPLAKSLARSLPLVDWCDSFSADLHFQLNSSPSVWSAFLTNFARTNSASDFQRFLD
ncbi:hypothetical protein ACA910_021173 [Epithemia clementina (nom. ined.)]